MIRSAAPCVGASPEGVGKWAPQSSRNVDSARRDIRQQARQDPCYLARYQRGNPHAWRTRGMDLSLKGKSVLVTGGNRGIGLAIALAFAGEGANVAVCGRDKAALADAEAKIAGKGVREKAVSVDLFTAAGC